MYPSLFLKGLVVGRLCIAKKSSREIEDILHDLGQSVSRQTILNWNKKFKTGKILTNNYSGSAPKVDDEIKKKILIEVEKDRSITTQ